MGLIRLLLIGLLVYFVYRFVRRVFQPRPDDERIKGKPKRGNKPAKFKDIEDADYEEIDE